MEKINEILNFEILKAGEYTLKVSTLLTVLIIIIVTKLVLSIIKKAVYSKRLFKKLDRGNAYSIFQIIRYLLWIIAITFILDAFGIKVTVLLAGSAALLVGVGLGLQQTFNDFISGLILLWEGTTRIGDVLEVEGEIIKIQSIGLRTSKGLTRNEIVVIIPNSLITTNRVINWTNQSKKTRFNIKIGVAYGSDVDLVIKVLKESVLEHPDIMDKSAVDVRFLDFGESSLDFKVLFFSRNVFRIEKIKSDIRKIIYKKFNENNIKIPFPQRDVYINPDNKKG